MSAERMLAHDEVAQWRSRQRGSDARAAFFPGDKIRCPVVLPTRVRCAAWLQLWAKPGQQVVVRAMRRGQRSSVPSLDARCPSCQAPLEVFPLLEVTG